MNKKELREIFLDLREKMPEKVWQVFSEKICDNLENCSYFQKAEKIMFFMPKDKEPNIKPLIEKYLNKKEIFLPCLSEEKGIMHARKLENINQLKKNNFDIYEPCKKQCELVKPEKIDLILVPALAIDKEGQRIGFGMGYYDRFLTHTPAFRLCVAFSWQIVDKIFSEAHDMSTQAVITENGLHKF